MGLYVSQTLPDGSEVIGDSDNPNVHIILRAGQFGQLAGLPDSEQRHRVREFMAANRAGPDPRTERDEQAMQGTAEEGTGSDNQDEGRER